MKSALPYLGIVMILLALSVLISFFMKVGFGSKEEIEVGDNIVKGGDFPQVGDAEENRQEQIPDGFSVQHQEEGKDQVEIKTSPEEIISGILERIGKQANVNAASFKWQKSDGRGTVALGYQAELQGKGADISKAKEYLREQDFFLDANNLITSGGINAEGFLRDSMACIISSDSVITNNFVAEEDYKEAGIRVSCGILKQR